MLKAIEASTGRGLARALYGLGVRHVGEKAALVLAERFESIDRLMAAAEQRLQEIREVGPVMAEAVAQFFRQPSTKQVIERLRQAGVQLTQRLVREARQPLEGMTFVVTGEFSGLTRTQIETLIRRYGGRASSSVSKKTSYVILGDHPGSKLKKAQALGVAILDAAGFTKLIGQ